MNGNSGHVRQVGIGAVRQYDAELVHHVTERLVRERRFVPGTVKAHYQAVADQLVGTNTFNPCHILEAVSQYRR